MALVRAVPPVWLGLGLGSVAAAYVVVGLFTTATASVDSPAGEFDFGASLSVPTVLTVLAIAVGAAVCWAAGGRGARVVAMLASVVALERLLRVRNSLGVGEGEGLAMVELVVAVVFLVGVVWWCRSRLGAVAPAELGPRLERMGRQVALAVPFRAAVVVLVLLVVGLVAIGALVVLGGVSMREFRMPWQRTVPAWTNSALLAAGASLALLRGRAAGSSRWWFVIAGVLAFMAIDEPHGLHQRLELRSGYPTPVILFPVAVAGALAWLGTVRAMPGWRAVGLYAAGGALWVISQALDTIEGVAWKAVVEDGCELAGSSCLLLALLLAVQHPRPGGAALSSPRDGGPAGAAR